MEAHNAQKPSTSSADDDETENRETESRHCKLLLQIFTQPIEPATNETVLKWMTFLRRFNGYETQSRELAGAAWQAVDFFFH